jgi:murein DD-endopeptidase MepM/ murein hydrolase activator NlpD
MSMPPSSPRPATPYLEVQVHPGDIRRGVSYLFLTRRQVAIGGVVAVLYLAFLVFGAALAPRVVGNLLSYRQYAWLVSERTQQGDRLRLLVGRLGELQQRGDELRLKMSKIHLAYGLDAPESIGQGGYPFRAAPAPDSIYTGAIEYGNRLESGLREQLRVLDSFLGEIQAFETAHREQVRTTPSLCPLRGGEFVLTSPFGTRRSPFTKAIDFHSGLDLAAPVGTAVIAPADGTVVFAGRYPLRDSVGWWRYGNLVAIRHGDRFVSLYGHLDTIQVRQGQRVRQGDSLAGVGSTGWSTSPHLHYEVRLADGDRVFRPVDPRIYILDHRWRDEERLLVRARSVPEGQAFEPLPPLIGRS